MMTKTGVSILLTILLVNSRHKEISDVDNIRFTGNRYDFK